MDSRLPFEAPGAESEFARVEVRRSPRRRKTVSAEIVGDALVVSVPDRISRAEEQRWVARMTEKMAQRQRRDRLNAERGFEQRAALLADTYLDGVRPREISWTETQKTRWGYCDPDAKVIRLSLGLCDYPEWVRDYVIVHELAHILVPD